MPLSFRQRLRPFGSFFERIGRKAGEALVKSSGFVERGLGKIIPLAEKILGFVEKVPIPQVQKAAAFGRGLVAVGKEARRGAGQAEKFSKKLLGRNNNGSKTRVKQLISQSSDIR